MLKKALNSQFIQNNTIVMAGTVLGGFLGYLFHFIVSRQMSVAQYGELQSLLSISIIFGFFNSALSYFTVKHTSVFAANKDYEANKEFIEYLVPRIFRYAVILLVILIIFSPLLASLLHFSSFVGFLAISLATFFSSMTVIYFEILRGWHKFALLSIIGVAIVFVKFASGVGFAAVSHKASVVSFAFLISAFTGWYLARYYSLKKNMDEKSPDSIAGWREKYFSEINVRKSAINIFIFSLALVLVSNVDVVLVKYFSSEQITGYYSAFGLIGKIILWLNLAVVSVMLPGACADGHLGKRPQKKQILSSYGLMAIIGLTLIAIFYFFPNLIVSLFFGKKYLIETQLLWLFGLAFFLLSILTFEANLSFAKHDFRVVYFLAATTILMIFGLSKFHNELREIILVFSGSFLLGYVSVTMLNISHEKRRKNILNSL